MNVGLELDQIEAGVLRFLRVTGHVTYLLKSESSIQTCLHVEESVSRKN